QNDADDADRRVLTVQIRLGARLDRGGDLLHARAAGRLRENLVDPDDPEDDGHNRAGERKDETVGHVFSPEASGNGWRPPRLRAVRWRKNALFCQRGGPKVEPSATRTAPGLTVIKRQRVWEASSALRRS